MKKIKTLIPLVIILALFLALFCVNRYNTNKRREMALETIRTGIVNYVFAGTHDNGNSLFKYAFTFVDEDTVTVKLDIRDSNGRRTSDIVRQDFEYRIVVEKNSFKLKVGKAKNEISTLYKVAKLGPSEGTFLLTDYSYEGEDVYRAVYGIQMYMSDSALDTFLLDLKTPDKGSKTIMLPGDIILD